MRTALFILVCFAGVALGQPASIFQGVNQVVAAAAGGGSAPGIFNTATNQGTSGKIVTTMTSIPAGALLLVLGGVEISQETGTCTSSVAGLTFDMITNGAGVANQGSAGIWKATFTAGGTINVTNGWSANHAGSYLVAITNQNATWGGVKQEGHLASGTGAPTLSITPATDQNLVVCVNSDFTASAGAITYLPAGSTALPEIFPAGAFRLTCWYKIITPAAATTFGQSAPSAQAYSIDAIAINP